MLHYNFLIEVICSGDERQYGLVLFLEKVADQQSEDTES